MLHTLQITHYTFNSKPIRLDCNAPRTAWHGHAMLCQDIWFFEFAIFINFLLRMPSIVLQLNK